MFKSWFHEPAITTCNVTTLLKVRVFGNDNGIGQFLKPFNKTLVNGWQVNILTQAHR